MSPNTMKMKRNGTAPTEQQGLSIAGLSLACIFVYIYIYICYIFCSGIFLVGPARLRPQAFAQRQHTYLGDVVTDITKYYVQR